MLELLDLRKDSENVGGRGAGLEPGDQRMREKVLLHLFSYSEGHIKDGL